MSGKMQSNILVTGGAGFIGSNFLPFSLDKYTDYFVVNIDSLTYAGNLDHLSEIARHPRYKFVNGDICERKLVKSLMDEYRINAVIHFAAESHVDNSILHPELFVKTNVLGTFSLLESAKQLWMDAPFVYREAYKGSRFLHISTDEVFGSLGAAGLFSEETPYAPNSPYSASKAGADMLVRSYCHTFGLNTLVTNCSNNYGPKQHKEKLIPTIINKALNMEEIPIYGDGGNIRDWLYVMDHCKALDAVFHRGKVGESYNIGGHNEKKNIDIAKMICEILDELAPTYRKDLSSYSDLITFVEDRPGHDKRYAVCSEKIRRELGWSPEESFQQGIRETIRWYLDKYEARRRNIE